MIHSHGTWRKAYMMNMFVFVWAQLGVDRDFVKDPLYLPSEETSVIATVAHYIRELDI